jgi:hypothetical protein
MKDSFVYIWTNKTNGRKYVGYHKGTLDDGYISSTSNDNFWKDFDYDEFEREIIFEGTRDECLKYEQDYLKSIAISSDEWYNNARGAEIIFTQEVKDKIRNHHLGKPSGMLGKNHSEKTKLKISIASKDRIHTEEWNKKVSQALIGKLKSKEHRKNLSLARIGSKNEKNRDSKLYHFFNIQTKESIICTKYDFYKNYNFHEMNVYRLANKKTKILGGTWILENS